MAKRRTAHKRGRDTKTGRFIPVSEAQRRKATAVVETVKKKRTSAKTKSTGPRKKP